MNGQLPFKCMTTRLEKHSNIGGIHGICILVKNAYASNCSVVTEFMSESVLWLHISKPVIGYEFIFRCSIFTTRGIYIL